MRYLLIIMIVLSAHAAPADIYKCVDADGTITYSNTGCPKGAQEIDKRPEINAAETKKQLPRVPLKDHLNHMRTAEWYRILSSPQMVIGMYGVMSLFCFVATYRDKRKSIKGQWRTPERTLHLLEMLGGWPGGLVAQQMFRHKTKKVSYRVTFWCIVGLHGLIWADVLSQHAMSRAVIDFASRLI
ncbi:MAG: DUF1294 domain-containing protein [Desulfobacteraceae bacterium]|nr:DUF1294 domain-containing protein [Desulfobacteraceae bacterium]